MASITDFIAQQVKSAAGNVDIPSNLKDQVLGGLSDSVLGSLKQTATSAGGVEQIKNLLTGKISAASSPITALAGNLFKKNVTEKLGLGALGGTVSNLIPNIMGGLSNFITDKDGDGDVDFNDIILSLTGGSAGGGILGAAKGLLGGLFGKKG